MLNNGERLSIGQFRALSKRKIKDRQYLSLEKTEDNVNINDVIQASKDYKLLYKWELQNKNIKKKSPREDNYRIFNEFWKVNTCK